MSRNIIPPALAPYLQHDAVEKTVSLITSTLATPAHWLLVRFVYQALYNTSRGSNQPVTGHANPTSLLNGRVVFVSLLRTRDLWIELCRKVGLDLPALAKSQKFVYVDGVASNDDSENDAAELPFVRLPHLNLDRLGGVITNVIQSSIGAASGRLHEHTTVIIDGIDFLMATQPMETSITVQQTLLKLGAQVEHLVISCNADSPLMHHRDGLGTPLEKHNGSLVVSLAHSADLMFQLRNLNTGAAKDVTGILRVSHSGNYETLPRLAASTPDCEWLYHWKGDGSVRLWTRGE